jgi:DNA polymerase-3 subunit beta
MEARLDREILYKCISRIQSIIEKKTNMPILSSVLINASEDNLRVSATDLELGFEQIISAEVIDKGSITISGRMLLNILKESKSDRLYIKEENNNWVFLSDGDTQYNLASYPADEYPVVVEPEGVNLIDIKADLLSEMINKTISSIAREGIAPKLAGIFIEKFIDDDIPHLSMVSTDGHRLSIIKKKIPGAENLYLEKGVVIPKKGMLEINKMASEGGTIKFGFGDKVCVFKRKSILLVLRLLDSKYPSYNKFIPDKIKQIVRINKESFLDSMKRMVILSNENYSAVNFHLKDNLLGFISTNPGIGEGKETLSVKYQGDEIDLVFNPRFFIEILQSMESEEVLLGFASESSPCVLTGEADEGFLGVIMPMRF